ncbi:MAG TPA: DUF167 domain-containing protein [Candidatus Binatia bacterium]|nr:DUF167 domain-containing protein [Candidatus Binatia bacterium]
MARRISVTVKPNSKAATITEVSDSEFRVSVREPAHGGKANRGVIDLLARHFGIPKSAVTIVRGHSSRRKLSNC